jgi:hypothetical protein
MLLQVRFSRHKVHGVAFLQVCISKENPPEVVSRFEKHGQNVVALLAKICGADGIKAVGVKAVAGTERERVILKGVRLAEN